MLSHSWQLVARRALCSWYGSQARAQGRGKTREAGQGKARLPEGDGLAGQTASSVESGSAAKWSSPDDSRRSVRLPREAAAAAAAGGRVQWVGGMTGGMVPAVECGRDDVTHRPASSSSSDSSSRQATGDRLEVRTVAGGLLVVEW